MDDISLAIVTHNSERWIEPLARSWQENAKRTRLHSHVVIADSGSTDSTRSRAAAHFPSGVVLDCGDIGFGAAANAAMARTATRYVVLANPDATFEPSFFDDLLLPLLSPLEALDPPPLWHGVACIAPRLLNPDRTNQPSVGEFPTVFNLLRDQFRPREQRKYLLPQPAEAGMVDWATGACLVLRRDVFDELRGFDEKFFLYVEEVDLQRRLWNAGHQTWFAPEGSVIHHHPNAGRPPRTEVQRWAANGLIRYFAKHGTNSQFLAARLLSLLACRCSIAEAVRGRAFWMARSTNPRVPT